MPGKFLPLGLFSFFFALCVRGLIQLKAEWPRRRQLHTYGDLTP
jgi:hypothetical protein